MLDIVEAISFIRIMTTGRNSPSLLRCIQVNGEEIEVITKLSFKCETSGLIREAIAAMLAKDLGLPIPEPFLVKIGEQFGESLKVLGDDIASSFESSQRFAFGSKKLPPAFLGLLPDSIPSCLMQQALEIFAFDSVIQNEDRKSDNPNYLTDGKNLAIFDHELAFMFDILSTPPWQRNGLSYMKDPYGHVFYSLFQKHRINISRFFNDLKGISDDRLNEYRSALPECWCTDGEDSKIIKYLRDCISNASLIQNEFERTLS